MPKPNQSELPIEGPGVAPVKIPALDKLIDKYVVARDARMEESPKEKAAKTILVNAIIELKDKIGTNDKGEIHYRHGDEVVIVKPGSPKLSIRASEDVEE